MKFDDLPEGYKADALENSQRIGLNRFLGKVRPFDGTNGSKIKEWIDRYAGKVLQLEVVQKEDTLRFCILNVIAARELKKLRGSSHADLAFFLFEKPSIFDLAEFQAKQLTLY